MSLGLSLSETAPSILAGATWELAPIGLAYTLASLPSEAPRASLARGAASVFALQMLLAGSDWAHFEMTSQRVNQALLATLRAEAILPFLGSSTLPWLLAALVAAGLLFSLGTRAAIRARPVSGAVVLVGALAAGLVASPTVRPEAAGEASWLRDRQLRMIGESSWGNLATQLVRYWRLGDGAQEAGFGRIRALPPLTPEEWSELAALGLVAEGPPRGGAPERPAFERIVVVVAESLALELIPPYGRVPSHVMPFISSLVEPHPSLSAYWSTNTPTDPGLWAMFRSRPAFDPRAVEDDGPTLFTALEDAGWRTVFARSYWARLWDHAERYPRWFGIRHLLGAEDLLAQESGSEPPPRLWHWGLNDCDLLSAGAEILATEASARLLLVLKTNDTHYPYGGVIGPEALKARPLLRALASLDFCFKTFVRHLLSTGFFDERSLLILTADHSPNHGAHRHWTGAPDYRPGRIPLLLIAGERAPRIAVDRDRLASQIDFAPTLLDLAGVPVPDEFWGRSLVGSSRRDLAITYESGDLLFRTRDGTIVVPFGGAALRKSSSTSPRRRALARWVLARRTERSLSRPAEAHPQAP